MTQHLGKDLAQAIAKRIESGQAGEGGFVQVKITPDLDHQGRHTWITAIERRWDEGTGKGCIDRNREAG